MAKQINKERAARNAALFEALAAARDAADPAAVAAAEDALLVENAGLVRAAVAPFEAQAFRDGSLPDLLQAGREGLLSAIRKWDPQAKTLAVFARKYISGQVMRTVCRTSHTFHGDTYQLFQDRQKVHQAAEALSAAGQEVTAAAVARQAGVTVATVEAVWRPSVLSLSAPLGDDDGRRLVDVVADRSESGGQVPAELAGLASGLGTLLESGQVAGVDVVAFAMRLGVSGRPALPVADVAYAMGRNRGQVRASVERVTAALAAGADRPQGRGPSPWADAAVLASDPRSGAAMDDRRLAAALPRMGSGEALAVLVGLEPARGQRLAARVSGRLLVRLLERQAPVGLAR